MRQKSVLNPAMLELTGGAKAFIIWAFWVLAVGVLAYYLGYYFAGVLLLPVSLLELRIPPKAAQLVILSCQAGYAALAFFYLFKQNQWKGYTARLTRDLRQKRRLGRMGKGGGAEWAGLLDEWDSPYKAGAVLLGKSARDGEKIGLLDDRGLLTIAANRSGKGRSSIIPNLLWWPHSAVVIDPKGTNAAVTAARRGKGGGRVTDYLGQTVYTLDPFQVVQGVQSSSYNPLAEIDLNGLTAREDLGLISDALIIPSSGDSAHWDEGARLIVTGILCHVKTLRKDAANLVDLRDVLKLAPDAQQKFINEMAGNKLCGGVASAAAAMLLNAGDAERGSFMTTINRNTSWLDSPAMAQIMLKSDFKLVDLKHKPATVYVVLPPHMLTEHARFLRLFVNMTVKAASVGGKAKHNILLVMDEFYSLGTLNSLAKAAGALAGYGLRLWPIVQNLTQMKELYPANWQTFFANAGAVQVFGVNDRATSEEIAARLGSVSWLDTINDRDIAQKNKLIEANEIELLTERETNLQLVLVAGKNPMILKKTPYDQEFDSDQFNVDPDYS